MILFYNRLIFLVTIFSFATLLSPNVSKCDNIHKQYNVGGNVPDAEHLKRQHEKFDHSKFDSLLMIYVRDGKVDFVGLKRDVALLDKYLETLAEANTQSYSKEEKLAFYINAHQALLLRLILKFWGKLKTINDIRKPWDRKVGRVENQLVSLNDIEINKLLKPMKDPRIFFAVSGCYESSPKMFGRAFNPDNIYDQLDAATSNFFSDSQNFHIEGNVLYLNSLFKTIGGYFSYCEIDLLDFVAKYIGDNKTKRLKTNEMVIKYFEPNFDLSEMNMF